MLQCRAPPNFVVSLSIILKFDVVMECDRFFSTSQNRLKFIGMTSLESYDVIFLMRVAQPLKFGII